MANQVGDGSGPHAAPWRARRTERVRRRSGRSTRRRVAPPLLGDAAIRLTGESVCTSRQKDLQVWKEMRTLGVVGEHGMTAECAALDSNTDFLFGLRRVGEELGKTWDSLNKPGISLKNW